MVCGCGADLGLLACLDAVADSWFNASLAALEQGRRGEALEWMSACCRARPSEVAAWLALARLWAQGGSVADARRCLDEVAKLDPGHAELGVMRTALTALEGSAVRIPGNRKTRRRKGRNGADRQGGRRRGPGRMKRKAEGDEHDK